MTSICGEHKKKSRKSLFSEWLGSFSREWFVFLKVYFDESVHEDHKEKVILIIGGYIARKTEWELFSKRWLAVLEKHKVKHFHFRKFNSKKDCEGPESPYLGWGREKRYEFFYDLALTLCSSATHLVPVTAGFRIKEHIAAGFKENPYELLFNTFFNEVNRTLNHHWQDCDGSEPAKKVQFIFDKGASREWVMALLKTHNNISDQDRRYGGLVFEDDELDENVGLQAADFVANIYRQVESVRLKTGKTPLLRIVDYIFFRHLFPKWHPAYPVPPDTTTMAFLELIRVFRIDELEKKKQWAKLGQDDRIYYPEKDFPFAKYGITKYRSGSV